MWLSDWSLIIWSRTFAEKSQVFVNSCWPLPGYSGIAIGIMMEISRWILIFKGMDGEDFILHLSPSWCESWHVFHLGRWNSPALSPVYFVGLLITWSFLFMILNFSTPVATFRGLQGQAQSLHLAASSHPLWGSPDCWAIIISPVATGSNVFPSFLHDIGQRKSNGKSMWLFSVLTQQLNLWSVHWEQSDAPHLIHSDVCLC